MVSGPVIRLILAGTLAHVVVGRWVDSPWVLPDLTLVGICMAASHPSASMLDVTLMAGLLPMLASWGEGWEAGLGYAASAAMWRWAGSRWDLANRRLSLGAVAALELGLVVWWLWRSGAWSWEMWTAVPLRVVSTAVGWALAGWWSSRREAFRDA